MAKPSEIVLFVSRLKGHRKKASENDRGVDDKHYEVCVGLGSGIDNSKYFFDCYLTAYIPYISCVVKGHTEGPGWFELQFRENT